MHGQASLQVSDQGPAVIHACRVPPEIAIQEHVPRNGPAIHTNKDVTAPGRFLRARNELPCPGQGRTDTRRAETGIEVPADAGRQPRVRIGPHIAKREAGMRGKVRLKAQRQLELVQPLQALGNNLDPRLILQLVIPPLRPRNTQHLVPVVLDKLPACRRANHTEIDLQRILHLLLHVRGRNGGRKGEPARIRPVTRIRISQGNVFRCKDGVRQAEALAQIRPLHIHPRQTLGHPFETRVHLVSSGDVLDTHAVRIVPVRAGAEHVVL